MSAPASAPGLAESIAVERAPTLASVTACRKIVEMAALAFPNVTFTLTTESEEAVDQGRRILTVLPVRER